MPIDTVCPHCHRSYRLKDEAAGKRALCQNPDCRKPFVVAAKAANGPPAPKPPPPPKVDAEALAAAALADEPAAGPDEGRAIPMTCPTCDHKWEVGWDKQGKNVLCPECRSRVRVPEQKKAKPSDWRTGQGRPSLAKVEGVEGAVGTVDAKMVSGETLRKTGVIEEDIEPRPRWHYFAATALVLGVVGGLVFGVMSLIESRKDNRQSGYMAEAMQNLPDPKDTPLPAAEVPLFRAALHLAAGEYALRQNDPAKLKLALDHYAQARVELDQAPSNPGRDFLLGELAVAEAGLLGTDEQVAAGIRLRPTPQARDTRVKSEGKIPSVQDEIRSTFTTLRKDGDADVRFLTFRRVTRELTKRGHGELTLQLVPTAFPDADHPEAQAEAAFEALTAGDPNPAKKLAEEFKRAVVKPPTAQALFDAVDPPVAAAAVEKPTGPTVGDKSRQGYTAAYIAQGKWDEAVALGRKPADTEAPDSQARSLALTAEHAADPGPAVTAAVEVVRKTTGQKNYQVRDVTLTRLAIQAGRTGDPKLVEPFAKAIQKPEYKAWAQGEATRQLLLSGKFPGAVEESMAEVPDDPRNARVGHAWGRLALARHNAKVTNNTPDASLGYDRWGKGTYRPFGLAGLALGLQDREQK